MIEITWAQLKSFVDARALSIQEIDMDDRLLLVVFDGQLSLKCYIHKTLETANLADYEDNYQDGANLNLGQMTTDGRSIIAVNRIPAGFTIYPTGKADALQANGYRAGDSLIFDANNKVRRFRMNSHWYGIGGRVIWQGSDLDDYISGKLVAPATVGTNTAGDFDKVALGGGLNVFVPATPGQGAWTLDIAEKFTGTQVLKCTPVPKAGNTGFFDYDSDANTLSVNYTQTGGYNLYDFDATLFQMGSHCWGRNQEGAESSLEIPGVVGKLLYNSWAIDFTLTTEKTSGIKVGLVMITSVKSNT